MESSLTHPGTLLVVLDLVGIFVFAITGALVGGPQGARRLRRCWCSPASTGLGGGFLRDVLIGATPRRRWPTGATCWCPAVAGLVTFFFHPALGRKERVINVLRRRRARRCSASPAR